MKGTINARATIKSVNDIKAELHKMASKEDYQLVKDDRKSQLETIRRAVGNELFSIAEQEAGKNATLADIERILAKMLA
jgi:hypothetical protein